MRLSSIETNFSFSLISDPRYKLIIKYFKIIIHKHKRCYLSKRFIRKFRTVRCVRKKYYYGKHVCAKYLVQIWNRFRFQRVCIHCVKYRLKKCYIRYRYKKCILLPKIHKKCVRKYGRAYFKNILHKQYFTYPKKRY